MEMIMASTDAPVIDTFKALEAWSSWMNDMPS